VTTDRIDIPDHVTLVGEAHSLRGAIRQAADRGDVAEVTRLVRRIHDLELELFAREITDVRHARAQRGRGGGYNPQLERVEARLSEMLARLGVPLHRQSWQG
jgi:hypothetical protein